VRLVGTLVFGSVLAGAGLAYFVHQRSAATGQSYSEVLLQLPGEARRAYEGARKHAALALEDGLTAARRREEQVVKDLLSIADRQAG
jgi:hypothetical protein